MIRHLFVAAISFALAASTPSIAVAADDRCALVGKLAVSAYLTFFAELSNGRQDKATNEAGRTSDVIALYNQLGCDGPRLNRAIECLTDRLLDRGPSAPNLIAKDCIRDAGLMQL